MRLADQPWMQIEHEMAAAVRAICSELIERLQLLVMPKAIRVFPGPSDFIAVAETIRDVSELFNDFVRAFGDEVECNSPYHVDSADFEGVFTDSSSNAIYACEAIAERMQDEKEAA